jgi:phosphoribosylformylglycinamidine cyclo-ligase
LIRRVIDQVGADLRDDFQGRPLGHLLLAPTRIYCRPVLTVLETLRLKGMAHITGGGLLENVPRVLPDKLQAVIRRGSWPRPPVFDWLQRNGQVADDEMHRVFNCGIGMVLVVAASDGVQVRAAFEALGERCWEIGIIAERKAGAAACVVL